MDKYFSLYPSKDSPKSPATPNLPTAKPSPAVKSSNPCFSQELGLLGVSNLGAQVLETHLMLDEQHLLIEEEAWEPYQQTHPHYVFTQNTYIPNLIQERLRASPQATCIGGVLPQIHRVWCSIDNTLFLWDYNREDSLLEYPGIQDVILDVICVERNPEIFVNKVTWMLYVVTKTVINVLAVVTAKELRLIKSDIEIPTDEVEINKLIALDNGRVFIGAEDGKVSELSHTYSSWFSSTKKLKKHRISGSVFTDVLPEFIKQVFRYPVKEMTVDSSRNILYTLQTKPHKYLLEVHDLGESGNLNKKVTSISSREIYQRLVNQNHRLLSVDPDRLRIVDISAITLQQSQKYHLLGITQNGIRVLFSFHETVANFKSEFLSKRPTKQYSLTVKLPPDVVGISRSIPSRVTSDKNTDFQKAFITEEGKLILLEGNSKQTITCIRKNLSRIAKLQYYPSSQVLDPNETVSMIEGSFEDILCLCEVSPGFRMQDNLAELCNYKPRSQYRKLEPARYSETLSVKALNSLSNFVYIPSSELLVLTSKQLLRYTEVRPIDFLVEGLNKSCPEDEAQVHSMLENYGAVHVCSMLLALLSSPIKVRDKNQELNCPVSGNLKNKAFEAFKQIGNFEVRDPGMYGSRVGNPLVCMAENKAFYLHLGRILRPIWGEKLTHRDSEINNQLEQFTANQLLPVKERLELFLKFLNEKYSEKCQEAKALKITKAFEATEPQDPVVSLYQLITRSLNALELMSMVSEDYAFRKVVSELKIKDKQTLSTFTFGDLIYTSQGMHLAKALVKAYIAYTKSPSLPRTKRVPFEVILKKFNQKCSQFFSQGDADVLVAEECLKKALVDSANKDEYLDEALQRLKRNSAFVDLPIVGQTLKSLGQFRGLAEICLKKAQECMQLKGDECEEVEECYDVVFGVLVEIQSAHFSRYSTSSLRLKDEELSSLKREILQECYKVYHKSLHWAVFTWLCDIGEPYEILSSQSEFVESYLKKHFGSDKQETSCLLGKYYMKFQRYEEACKEFQRIAFLEKESLPIEDRIQYLDLIKLCLEKVAGASKDHKREECLSELEELKIRKQVAKIQYSIKIELISMRVSGNYLARIDDQVYKTDELYRMFAEPLNMFDKQFELLGLTKETSPSQTEEAVQKMKDLFRPMINQFKDTDWPHKVIEKLQQIGNKFPNEFNLGAVIESLEEVTSQKPNKELPIIEALKEMDIPQGFAEIFDVYMEILKDRRRDLAFVECLLRRLRILLIEWFNSIRKKTFEPITGSLKHMDKSPKFKFENYTQAIKELFALANPLIQELPRPTRRELESAYESLSEEFYYLMDQEKLS